MKAILQVADRARELWRVSFTRTPIPFMRSLLSSSKHIAKVPPLNTITLGFKISAYEFGRDTIIQTIAHSNLKFAFTLK